jgi:hypothetical protein
VSRVNGRVLVVVLLTAVPLLSSCSQPIGEGVLGAEAPPVTVRVVEGSDVKMVSLVTRSAERLGIQTEAVREELVGGVPRIVMPYAALLYDEHGDTWAFTNTEGLTFIRHPVTVDRIEGDLVVLLEGPAVGTIVVTAGAAELYGAETGVGGGH